MMDAVKTQNDVEQGEVDRIVTFLDDWATNHGAPLSFYSDGVRSYSPDLLSLPTASGNMNMGAYESASVMQDAEEAWNYQVPAPQRQILLVPVRQRPNEKS
jgi:hypothetical protein